MQTSPHDGSAQWLVTFFVSLFAAGVGFLVKHFLGREAAIVQLNLAQAQTDEIRARVRREDESAEFAHMRELAQEARADVGRLRAERDAAEMREKILALQLEREVKWRKGNRWPGPPGGDGG